MIPRLPLHVLVVDGDPAIRHLLVLILERQGWQITTAGDGQAALDLLDADLPDVLLMDVILPRRSGLDVLDWIENTDPSWLRHVIVLTGAAPHILVELMRVHSRCRVIRKPFDIEDLVNSVASCAETLGIGEYRSRPVASGMRL